MPSGKWNVGKGESIGLQAGRGLYFWIRRVKTRTEQKPLVVVSLSAKEENGTWSSGDGYFFEIDEFKKIVERLSFMVHKK